MLFYLEKERLPKPHRGAVFSDVGWIVAGGFLGGAGDAASLAIPALEVLIIHLADVILGISHLFRAHRGLVG